MWGMCVSKGAEMGSGARVSIGVRGYTLERAYWFMMNAHNFDARAKCKGKSRRYITMDRLCASFDKVSMEDMGYRGWDGVYGWDGWLGIITPHMRKRGVG